MDVPAPVTGFQEIHSILPKTCYQKNTDVCVLSYWVDPTNMYSNNFKFFHKYLQNISFTPISKIIQILRK
jgi:hypothetical protein